MSKRSLFCVAGLALFGLPLAAWADSTPAAPAAAAPPVATATPPAPTPPPDDWTKHVTFEGLVDTYYSHRFEGNPRGPNEGRVFDVSDDTFMLAYAELALTAKYDIASVRLDIGFGQVADLTSYDAQDPAKPGVSVLFRHVQQAYGTINIPGAVPVAIDVGKFVSTAGAEVIEAKSNWNYSRSFLFGYAVPFTHTGVRATATLSSAFSLQASLVNGWEVITDNNRYKTLGLSGTYNGPADTTVTLTGYSGVEATGSSTWRTLLDLVVLKKFGDKWNLSLNGDYGWEGPSSWYGVALAAQYAVHRWLNLAARAEYFDDPQNARGIGTSVYEGTLTAAVPVVPGHAELRAEVRHDQAASPIFDSGRLNGQTTLQFAMLAWF